ncbi:uncharacterized protein SCHCODRAFT_02520026 [Schizophyllum commune H4-8]|uniref:uncharacterized protein n=1 Tax=Schizophyllum commune (strain H4-8 / FGSC 9210) TaxID=578458 RepID=UPI00215FC9EB|nr:uncharacterized protein SCHCODRAFT_02520026 [Schizophyllum commune H4-8]KAI5885747.1 hypothetical protein SCHCODRAFT_02520026 [Schizophyllum commune H4-8]
MRAWLHRRAAYEDVLMRRFEPSKHKCQCGAATASYLCETCLGRKRQCRGCILREHASMPFHHIRKHDGRSSTATDLGALGQVIWLGHGGEPCPATLAHVRLPMDERWCDEGEEEEDGDLSDLLRDCDLRQGHRLIIGDVEGIWCRTVYWCTCPTAEDKDIQLLHTGLYPGTEDEPATAFTLTMLDDFLLSQCEGRMSAQGYVQKLRRMANPAFPYRVSDVYRPFLRAMRQYTNMITRAKAGVAHKIRRDQVRIARPPGDLAWRCPACPQPGYNLPPEDQRDADHPELYMPMFTHDGCFKLNNQRTRNPDADVRLSDGECMLVGSRQYQTHLKVTKEPANRKSCQNHRAVASSRSRDRNLAASGVGTYACARHGLFIPHTTVDYQKGEAQMNTDYSTSCLIEGLSAETHKILIAYDIMCEYIVNLKTRLTEGPYLTNRAIDIEAAVGKFHLGAHIRECFAKFSPNFIKGAGQLDGEILETLWATLEKLASNTRSMSPAHRQEVLDLLMNDMNWKKIIQLADVLKKKAMKASVECKHARAAYEELKDTLSDQQTARWLQEERESLEEGREGKSVYDIREEQVPGVAERALAVARRYEDDDVEEPIGLELLREAMRIESVQDNLLPLAKQQNRTASQERQLLLRRGKLHKRICKFETRIAKVLDAAPVEGEVDLGDEEVEEWLGDEGEAESEGEVDEREGEGEDEDEDPDAPDVGLPERERLTLPSTTGHITGELADLERDLRDGQRADALRGVRLGLAERARLYRTSVRRGRGSHKTTTRAFAALRKSGARIARHVRMYHRARDALIALGKDESQLPKIDSQDLRINKDWTEENRTGQRSHTLPWFWRVGNSAAAEDGTEAAGVHDLYRVSFLRAKCRLERWEEEERLVSHEMLWTRLAFEKQQGTWQAAGDAARSSTEGAGWAAYAYNQADMWGSLVTECVTKFQDYAGTLPGWEPSSSLAGTGERTRGGRPEVEPPPNRVGCISYGGAGPAKKQRLTCSRRLRMTSTLLTPAPALDTAPAAQPVKPGGVAAAGRPPVPHELD